jgi:hypothetical protein
MANIPPPIGLPVSTGLAFDAPTFVAALTVLVMLAGLALLLWAVRTRERVTHRVRCPEHRTEAVIEIRTPRGDRRADVEKCSLCEPPTRVECEKRCLRPTVDVG